MIETLKKKKSFLIRFKNCESQKMDQNLARIRLLKYMVGLYVN